MGAVPQTTVFIAQKRRGKSLIKGTQGTPVALDKHLFANTRVLSANSALCFVLRNVLSLLLLYSPVNQHSSFILRVLYEPRDLQVQTESCVVSEG